MTLTTKLIKQTMGQIGSETVADMAKKLNVSDERLIAFVEEANDPSLEILVDIKRINGEWVSVDEVSYFELSR